MNKIKGNYFLFAYLTFLNKKVIEIINKVDEHDIFSSLSRRNLSNFQKNFNKLKIKFVLNSKTFMLLRILDDISIFSFIFLMKIMKMRIFSA